MKEQAAHTVEATYARNGMIISGITAVVLFVIAVIRLFTAGQYYGPLATIGLALIALICAVLCRYGRYMLGTRLLLGILLISLVFFSFLLEGGGTGGIALGVIGFMIGSTLAFLTRPQKQAIRWILAFIGAAIFAIFYDLFGPPGWVAVNNLQGLNYIAAVMVILYGIFILSQFPKFRLQAKLITATAMVAVISVLTVTIVVGITTRNALVAQVGSNLNSLAESQALALGEVMARQINIMETLALNRAVTDAVAARNAFYEGQAPPEVEAANLALNEEWLKAGSTDRLVLSIMNNSTSQQLKSFQQAFPDHTRILLTDTHGALVAASQQPEKFDFSEETWWQNAFSSGFAAVHVSQPYVSDSRDEVFVDIAVPVQTLDDAGVSEVAGVLLTTYSLTSLAEVLRQAAFGETGHFGLYFPNFRQMRIEEGGDGPLLEFIAPNEARLIERLWFNNLPFVNELFDGVSSLVSQARVNTLAYEPKVDSLDWRVVVEQEEAEALQPVEQQQRINIVLGVFIVILASVTAALIARLLARPIVRLTNTAVQVAEGDLSARAAVGGNDEIGTLAMTFNRMTDQLQESITGLEQRVAERTRALTASVEVSRSLSTVLDPEQLVVEVVEQVRAAFGYYYVQIYLFDAQHQQLHMVGGTGEAGQVLLARGHMLAAGEGLVGRAAASNEAVFIPDVAQAPDWKPNPLLPDTRAEIAIPIALGEQVLGVLDAQHDVTEGLVAEDVEVLQSVAYQVAIAIQNAQSFDLTRKRAEREALINAINQKIQNATSISAVLRISAEELGHALGGPKTSVQLFNPVHKTNGDGR